MVETGNAAPSAPPRWRRVTGSPWVHLLLAFVAIGLVLSFIAKPYWVPSSSMTDTLEVGDRVLVNRLAYVGTQPATGDIIVFDADETWGATGTDGEPWYRGVLRWVGEASGFGPSGAHTLVKRVIAGPGQTVECCDSEGRILIDGEPVDEPYITNDLPFTVDAIDCASEPSSTRCFGPVTVPEGSYLVLGDNRGNSSDSAAHCRTQGGAEDDGCWRWATRDDVVGKVVAILWPIDRWQVP